MPVKQPEPGDDLLHIAQREGVSQQAMLTHPDNRELFARRNARVLHEDDEIFVPASEPKQVVVAKGYTHYFVYKPLTRRLHLELRDWAGQPRQTDYTLKDFEFDERQPKHGLPLPDPLHGFAYQGVVEEELPAALKRATLLLEDDPEHPFTLELGRLEPISSVRGIKARLHNLGLYSGPLDAEFEPRLLDSLRAFQLSQGIPLTGQPDDETCRRLIQAHGA